MTSRIELFKMLLERNKVVIANRNARARSTYACMNSDKFSKKEREKRAKEYWKCNKAVYAFTKRTHKRRIELMHELRTCQRKRADNVVGGIWIGNEYYSLEDIKREVNEDTVERILLGEYNV